MLVDARPLQEGHALRGIGTYTRQLLAALIAAGFGERLACLVAPDRPPPSLPGGRPLLLAARHRARGRLAAYQDLLLLPGTLAALRPAAYHAVHPSLPGRAPCPLVVTVHDCIPWRLRGRAAWGERLRAGPARRLLARADVCLAVSAATAADLRRLTRIPPERIRVVPEGWAPGLAPRPGAAERVRARHGLVAPYLLHVGALDRRKDPLALVAAWRAARAAGFAGELVLVGDPGRQAPRDLGGARRLGYVPEEELADLLAAAGCLVLASQTEGFGLPALEAMACGCPVAAYRASSLPEVVGEAGRLVDPGDATALGRAAAELARPGPVRETARQRGLARAVARTWDAAARATIAAYEAVGVR